MSTPTLNVKEEEILSYLKKREGIKENVRVSKGKYFILVKNNNSVLDGYKGPKRCNSKKRKFIKRIKSAQLMNETICILTLVF